MRALLEKYARKMARAGLASRGEPLLGGLDAELSWNRDDPLTVPLGEVFDRLSINSLLFSRPAEPYRSIIEYLAGEADGVIHPQDCETRTFLHDLPVVDEMSPEIIGEALENRKSVIVRGKGIVTWGKKSPEQAFIFYSSVCFACFVKFFADCLALQRGKGLDGRRREVHARALAHLEPLPESPPELMRGPFSTEDQVLEAIAEAGRLMVGLRLVDSFFGNISLRLGDALYISQTTSSLDELEGAIDPCPMDGSTCASITASSEYTAHMDVIDRTGADGILHGHPKFAVIMSMDCDMPDCEYRGRCHIRCPHVRCVDGVPIVPGEVGTGPTGLCKTLPPALEESLGAIVYGHGVFTRTSVDFNQGFTELLRIEKLCRSKVTHTL